MGNSVVVALRDMFDKNKYKNMDKEEETEETIKFVNVYKDVDDKPTDNLDKMLEQ